MYSKESEVKDIVETLLVLEIMAIFIRQQRISLKFKILEYTLYN